MREGSVGLALLVLMFLFGALGRCDAVKSPVGGMVYQGAVR